MATVKSIAKPYDHVQGNADAPLELLEYGDYQCPHCARAYPIVKRIQKKMGDKLKFVFRNFPLAESHPDAVNAAIASEAAGLQNKFWEMHDHLFEHQDRLDIASLKHYAAALHLDVEQFEKGFDDRELMRKIDNDFERGVRSGVNGTPSFFINGEKYDGSWDEETLLAYLESVE